jgi:hypothetical protein
MDHSNLDFLKNNYFIFKPNYFILKKIFFFPINFLNNYLPPFLKTTSIL